MMMMRALLLTCAVLALACGKSDKKEGEASGDKPTAVEPAPTDKPADEAADKGDSDRGNNEDRVADDAPPPPPVKVVLVGAGDKPIELTVGGAEGTIESPDGDPGKGWHVREILGDNVAADASPALVLHAPDESVEIPKGVLRDQGHTLFVKLNRRGVARFRWFEGTELKGELRGLDRIEIKK